MLNEPICIPMIMFFKFFSNSCFLRFIPLSEVGYLHHYFYFIGSGSQKVFGAAIIRLSKVPQRGNPSWTNISFTLNIFLHDKSQYIILSSRIMCPKYSNSVILLVYEFTIVVWSSHHFLIYNSLNPRYLQDSPITLHFEYLLLLQFQILS